MTKYSSINKKSAMIDIETLSTENNAVVYEVGLICFTPTIIEHNEKEIIHCNISREAFWRLSPHMQRDRHISIDTMMWTSEQEGGQIGRASCRERV